MHDHTDKIEIKIFNEDSFLFLGTLIKIWRSNDNDPIITKKNTYVNVCQKSASNL